MEPPLSIDVVIATANRAQPLSDCLRTLQAQTRPCDTVYVIDSSDGNETGSLIASLGQQLPLRIAYIRTHVRSAAVQRNIGIQASRADVLVFLDDDVLLQDNFVEELVAPFEADPMHLTGGAMGQMTNAPFNGLSLLNRMCLYALAGIPMRTSLSGRLLGPGVNFLPETALPSGSDLDWMPSNICAYRRETLKNIRFGETFSGYSFAEDVHLSARVAERYKLKWVPGARLHHLGLGGSSQRSLINLGESMVYNRHLIMTSVMGRQRLIDRIHLFGFECIYGTLALLWASRGREVWQAALLLAGRLRAFTGLLLGRSPHQWIGKEPVAGRPIATGRSEGSNH